MPTKIQRGINEKQNPHLYSLNCETVSRGGTTAAGRQGGPGPPCIQVIIGFCSWEKMKIKLVHIKQEKQGQPLKRLPGIHLKG